jgi:hypothetical protein
MNRTFFALALALSVVPIGALAQDANAQGPTAEQRQAMRQAFQQVAQQEAQLHQQMRTQILSSMTPVHRRAVGAAIGNLAIEPNPDLKAAAKQLDAMLSPGERQRIISAHTQFAAQSRALHEQVRTQLQQLMPNMPAGPKHDTMNMQHRQLDAGTLLLMSLVPHPMTGMMGHEWMGPHMEGAPPQ